MALKHAELASDMPIFYIQKNSLSIPSEIMKKRVWADFFDVFIEKTEEKEYVDMGVEWWYYINIPPRGMNKLIKSLKLSY